VRLILRTQEAHRKTAIRLHGRFADNCPVYQA
jgi:hypothetical protein